MTRDHAHPLGEFDGDCTAEDGVAGAIHLTHASNREEARYLAWAEPVSRTQPRPLLYRGAEVQQRRCRCLAEIVGCQVAREERIDFPPELLVVPACQGGEVCALSFR